MARLPIPGGDENTWGTVLNSFLSVSHNSDGTIAASAVGTANVADANITYAKIQNVTDNRLLGRSAGSAGTVHEITIGSGLTLAGGTLSGSGGSYDDEQAQDAVGGILSDAGDIDFTYDDATPAISAVVKNDSVTYAKMQNVSATDKVLGRSTAGSGDVEEITMTAAGRALIDDADAAAQRTTLALVDANKGSFGISIDGGGSAITTGVKGYVTVPYGGTITSWRILCDVSGSIVIDVWKDTYANALPTVADSITASAKPTVTTAVKNESSTLTGWTTSVTLGDVIGFNVDSASTVTKATLQLFITKS